MELFLTSSPFLGFGGEVNPANDFWVLLKKALGEGAVSAVFAASDPEDAERTEGFGRETRDRLAEAGISFSSFRILDGRNAQKAPALLQESSFVILAGGHVPTQNAFFEKLGLRELLAGFSGTVMGISAGSMNAARLVYAQPELPGESIDPGYRRFLPGLGLTRQMILPHYGETKEALLDGKRLFEDITYPDSLGREFLILYDGSYLHGKDGREWVHGPSFLLRDGELLPLCGEEEMREVG